jgi:AcrR family transcriptional regulator
MTAAAAVLPTKRERNKASNRAALLVAAKAVFAEMGYDAASVRDIIRRTDLAAGTFYNYFNDKQEIFRAVIEELTTELRTEHSSGRAKATNLQDFVDGTFRAYFDFVAGDPDMVHFIHRNAGAIRIMLDQPEMTPLFDDVRKDLAAGIERGLLPQIDVGYLAAAIAGIAFEVSIVMVARDPVDPQAATRFASNLLLNGLRGGKR